MAAPKTKNRTIDEFKSWLEGIESFQDKKWTPSGEQWKLIRANINRITDNVHRGPVSNDDTNTSSMGADYNTAKYQTSIPQSSIPQSSIPQSSIPQSSIPRSSIPFATPSDNKSPVIATAEGQTTQTPNIDTSDGNYKSTFE